MHIDRYISSNRIIDISSKNLVSAYSELLDTFTTLLPTPAKRKKVLNELVGREKSLSSYLGEGVALPHARVPMKRPYALAIGRCPTGLSFEGKDSYEDIRFIFLLLANEKAKNYLSFLAALARSFQDNPHGPSLDGREKMNSVPQFVKHSPVQTIGQPVEEQI